MKSVAQGVEEKKGGEGSEWHVKDEQEAVAAAPPRPPAVRSPSACVGYAADPTAREARVLRLAVPTCTPLASCVSDTRLRSNSISGSVMGTGPPRTLEAAIFCLLRWGAPVGRRASCRNVTMHTAKGRGRGSGQQTCDADGACGRCGAGRAWPRRSDERSPSPIQALHPSRRDPHLYSSTCRSAMIGPLSVSIFHPCTVMPPETTSWGLGLDDIEW